MFLSKEKSIAEQKKKFESEGKAKKVKELKEALRKNFQLLKAEEKLSSLEEIAREEEVKVSSKSSSFLDYKNKMEALVGLVNKCTHVSKLFEWKSNKRRQECSKENSKSTPKLSESNTSPIKKQKIEDDIEDFEDEPPKRNIASGFTTANKYLKTLPKKKK